MTTSSHTKMLRQLKTKPDIAKKFLKHNAPKLRSHGKNKKHCKLCGTTRGMISSYALNICRRCFRDNAKNLGFKKYS
ncbi:MAG: 30S ribosomal protein S14 [Candidatus Nanoarchaeia archaeon]|nr:30S ribosomal protein S14 [Candidatus Nanoarchaeia archaeon]